MTRPRFAGSDYDEKVDGPRLAGQILRIRECMEGAGYLTLYQIELSTGDPQASISAQIRNLRKTANGGHTVDKRRRGKPGAGCWEYRFTKRQLDLEEPVQLSMPELELSVTLHSPPWRRP